MSSSFAENGISIQDLGVQFGSSRILANVNLQIPAGEFVSIVGPSGCGKSTLLRCVANLMSPSSGTVQRIAASDEHASSNKRNGNSEMSFVFQHANLLPWRSVFGNIALPLELAGCSRELMRTEVQRCRALVGLSADDDKKLPRMLSGGMQMRVSLARAIVSRPRLMLLDEPFGALDEILRQQMNEQLLQIWQGERTTMLFVTHNVSEAVFLSQRVVVLSKNPGTVFQIIDVPFPYPRESALRATMDFVRLVEEISCRLYEVAA
ncbi:MAG: ABC transporter ATP-binding protein [Pirellulaceae bacterium]